jgi:hypothetical protein
MATRSAIGVMHGEKAKVVYCHWDGYIDGVGRTLLEHYDSPKANHLVALGGISSLGSEVVIPEGVEHSYDAPHADITVFYNRDRGEAGNEFLVCDSDEDMFNNFGCDYFYIMRDGVWYVSQGKEYGWSLLSDEVRALTDETVEVRKLEGTMVNLLEI